MTRDSLNDELPACRTISGTPDLAIPYSIETNDNRFDRNLGLSTASQFSENMIDCFDTRCAERADNPHLMSVAVHDPLIGRPGRIAGLVRFLRHVTSHDRVWIATGRTITEHWRRIPRYPGTEIAD